MSIRIIGQELVFSSETKRLPTIRCQILSAFICPGCQNILKVYFQAKEQICQWRYEGVDCDYESGFNSVTVPGGQGLVDKSHDGYGSPCKLQIYWALNLKANLNVWLEENFPEYQFCSLDKAIELVGGGKIEGLYSVQDQYNNKDKLLGYDKSKWEIEWDYGKESYEKWQKRQRRELKQKIKLLGCVKKKTG